MKKIIILFTVVVLVSCSQNKSTGCRTFIDGKEITSIEYEERCDNLICSMVYVYNSGDKYELVSSKKLDYLVGDKFLSCGGMGNE